MGVEQTDNKVIIKDYPEVGKAMSAKAKHMTRMADMNLSEYNEMEGRVSGSWGIKRKMIDGQYKMTFYFETHGGDASPGENEDSPPPELFTSMNDFMAEFAKALHNYEMQLAKS